MCSQNCHCETDLIPNETCILDILHAYTVMVGSTEIRDYKVTLLYIIIIIIIMYPW